jgi:DNA-binding response OmpR family regulator
MSRQARILIVDDDQPTVMIISSVLQKQGYEVHTAYDGLAGLKKARKIKPDLIILDIKMPIMDGYQVCRRLKADPATARIAVLILTTKGQVDILRVETKSDFHSHVRERVEGFEAGAVEFLSKPVKAKELVRRVKSVLWSGGLTA